jgi:hypothetical protein
MNAPLRRFNLVADEGKCLADACENATTISQIVFRQVGCLISCQWIRARLLGKELDVQVLLQMASVPFR